MFPIYNVYRRLFAYLKLLLSRKDYSTIYNQIVKIEILSDIFKNISKNLIHIIEQCLMYCEKQFMNF